LRHFLGRGDVYFQGKEAFAHWRRVLALQDAYWVGTLPVIYGLSTLALLGLLYRLWRSGERLSARTAQGVLWLLLVGAWLYTLGAQQKDLPPYQEFILNIGYRLRNTYPPTLGFVFLLVWLALVGKPGRRVLLAAQVMVLSVGLLSWAAFLQERGQVYRLLWAMHTALRQTWAQEIGLQDGPVAFWTTKGLPIVDEAAFHWEGNYHPGRHRFSAEITARFPRFVLFELRRVPDVLRLLPPKPAGHFTRRDCRAAWEAGQAASAAAKLFPSVPYGGEPRGVSYWRWEERKALKVTPAEVRWALCAYGWPVEVSQFRIGEMRWVLLRLEQWGKMSPASQSAEEASRP